MLQSFRDKAQGWFAWIIIGAIAVTFVLFGTGSFFDSLGKDQEVVAKVNGTKIYAQSLDAAYQRFLHQPGAEGLRYMDPTFIKRELLQSLIDENITIKTALSLGMAISPSRIDSTIRSLPFLMDEGQFSGEMYGRFLMSSGYTDEGFRELVRNSLLKDQLQQGLIYTSFSLPEDIESIIKFALQKRDIRYLTISRQNFEKDINISNEDVKQYYDTHLKDFLTDEKVSLEYVHLSLDDLMTKHEIKDADVENYYRENISQYTEPERVHVAHILVAVDKNADANTVKKANEKVNEIQTKLKAGESFESLAKTYSDDAESAKDGGELEWLERQELVPEFETAAFSLEKVGQVSDPVKTQFGIHFIKLLAKQQSKTKPFSDVKDEIVVKLKQQLAEEQFATLADDMSTLAFDHPDSLQPIADKTGLNIQKSELFDNHQGPKEKVLQNPAIVMAAFSESVKNDKNNSDVIKVDEGNYLVARVAEFIPSRQKTLDEVNKDIRSHLTIERSEAKALAQAQKVLADLEKMKTAQSMEDFAWKEQKDLTRASHDMKVDILEAAFSMPRPSDKPVLKYVRLENGDYAIIWVTKVTDGNYNQLSAEEKENYKSVFAKRFGELQYTLYSNKLFNDAKVKNYLNPGA